MAAIILDAGETRKKKKSSNTRTKSSAAPTENKSSSALEDPIMLSKTQSFSFWNDNKLLAESYDETNATDDESYSHNSLESWGIDDERDYRRERAHSMNQQQALAACGDGITDASNVFMESLLDTTRAISLGIKHGYIAKTKLAGAFFPTKEEREKIKKERLERLEEERRLKREEQLRQEMRTAREEVQNVANLWRER